MLRKNSPAPETGIAVRVLRSFDGGVVAKQAVTRPETYRDLERLPPAQPRMVRGGGYSYAAASFGAPSLVQESRAFDRILDFDPDRGVIECEAGTTLEKLYRFLTPAGWCLPVQPGYPRITVGGCVAADVHGKNQYIDGTFVRSVLALRLFHPAHGIIEASPTENADVFALTCGGLGLTGHILAVRLSLQKLPAPSVRVFRRRIRHVADTGTMLRQAAASTPLLYTWHNFSARGAAFGRGFLYGADFHDEGVAADAREGAVRSIDSDSRGRTIAPLLNRYTTPLFNYSYEWMQRLSPSVKRVELFDFLFPVARKVVFFRLFGRRGFHEYQVIVPSEVFDRFVREIREYVVRHSIAVCLASAKIFGGAQSLLRFDGSGICLALDFPRDGRSAGFAQFLDQLVVRSGALPNLMKDSRLPRDVFEATYPEHAIFRERLRAYDPRRIYRSELSERLAL